VEADLAGDVVIPGDRAAARKFAALRVAGGEAGDAGRALVELALRGDVSEMQAGLAVFIGALVHAEAAGEGGLVERAGDRDVRRDLAAKRLAFGTEHGPELLGAAIERDVRHHGRGAVGGEVEAVAYDHRELRGCIQLEALAGAGG